MLPTDFVSLTFRIFINKMNPMRIARIQLLILLLFLGMGLSFAQAGDKITNVDWLLMSRNEKQSYIVSTMQNLRSQGVVLNKTPQQYIALIDAVTESPDLKPTTIDNIFTVSILVNEPGLRRTGH